MGAGAEPSRLTEYDDFNDIYYIVENIGVLQAPYSVTLLSFS
jgi:hypothetical protein